MKPEEIIAKRYEVLKNIALLPRKMLSIHGSGNMSEFVLHELCHQDCFNFAKAAYFIDNPDFNCLKGVAGLSQAESYPAPNIWQAPEQFSDHMLKSGFNQQVRSLMRHSYKKNNQSEQDVAHEIAQGLGLQNPGFCMLDLKHDNHGIFIFEKGIDDHFGDEEILNGLSLFSFCPIH